MHYSTLLTIGNLFPFQRDFIMSQTGICQSPDALGREAVRA
jgi:hypothetical protein